MLDVEYDLKLDELDRILNDPDSKLEPERVWSLLAEISQQASRTPGFRPGPAKE